MVILYLILAHLIADFLLQPIKLVRWKMKSVKGIIVHTGIHAIISMILLIPYLNAKTALIIIGLGICHGLIDRVKINASLKSDKLARYFIIDQILHLITILAAGFGILSLYELSSTTIFLPIIYNNIYLVLLLIMLVFASYTVEIYKQTTSKAYANTQEIKFNYNKMLHRILALTFIYMLFTLIGYLIMRQK